MRENTEMRENTVFTIISQFTFLQLTIQIHHSRFHDYKKKRETRETYETWNLELQQISLLVFFCVERIVITPFENS